MKTAKIFKNGQSQAVRLPKEFRFEGSEVYIKTFGSGIILFPSEQSWDSLFQSLKIFTEDFLESRNQNQMQKREEWLD